MAGGVESVSRVPLFADRGPLWTDPLTIRATVGSVHMGVAADLNATIEGFSREELDRYGVETQQKAASAWAGRVRPIGGTGRTQRAGPGTGPR